MVKFSKLESCSVGDCTNLAVARGLCQSHYSRWNKHGDTFAEKPIKKYHKEVLKTDRKKCKSCTLVKEVDEFTYLPTKQRFDTVCKQCRSTSSVAYRKSKRADDPDYWTNLRLKYNYGLNADQFKELETKQSNKCAICKRTAEQASNKRHTRLVVDHDHACCPGKKSCGRCVRGLLCYSCNQAIGQLFDSVEILQNAIDYLARTSKT